jgi:hypothetical protein
MDDWTTWAANLLRRRAIRRRLRLTVKGNGPRRQAPHIVYEDTESTNVEAADMYIERMMRQRDGIFAFVHTSFGPFGLYVVDGKIQLPSHLSPMMLNAEERQEILERAASL